MICLAVLVGAGEHTCKIFGGLLFVKKIVLRLFINSATALRHALTLLRPLLQLQLQLHDYYHNHHYHHHYDYDYDYDCYCTGSLLSSEGDWAGEYLSRY